MIGVIVLSHNPDSFLLERLRGVRRHADQLFIIDNASGPDALARVRETASELGCTLIENRENTGVAAGFNQGAAVAAHAGCDLLLLLDQDTYAEPAMIPRMLEILATQAGSPVALLAANYLDAYGRTAYKAPQGKLVSDVLVAISSGSLIPAPVYRDLGGMDERLFIDDVDHDFCLRARSRGYRVLVTGEPLMRHQVGAQKLHRFLGVPFSTSAHSPLRRYYMARNRVFLLRRFFRQFPGWLLTMCLRQLAETLVTLTLESGRVQKLRAVFLGILHGLEGQGGRLQPPGWMVTR